MSISFYAEGLPTEQDEYGEVRPLEVNLNNRNAALVSDALGHLFDEQEWWGEMDASDFLGRVVMALALAPEDEGMPAYEHIVVPGSARMIEGARPEGYLQERLKQLHALAEWAVANNRKVEWA